MLSMKRPPLWVLLLGRREIEESASKVQRFEDLLSCSTQNREIDSTHYHTLKAMQTSF